MWRNKMIENFNFLILFAAGLILAAVYVPASIELRKPSDNGPRIIEFSAQQKVHKTFPVNIEKSETAPVNPSTLNALDALPLLDDS
jgi:hypothetical protein